MGSDVENSPPRAPYIEDEIWGSSPRTKLKEGMSSKINFAQFPREPSTGHDIGSRTSKPSSPFEEPGSKILRGYCRAKGSRGSNPLHIKPKAHAEKEEMPEDEQRESRLLGYTAEDDPVLRRPKSRKGKVPCRQRRSPRASQRKFRAQWANHRSIVEKQF